MIENLTYLNPWTVDFGSITAKDDSGQDVVWATAAPSPFLIAEYNSEGVASGTTVTITMYGKYSYTHYSYEKKIPYNNVIVDNDEDPDYPPNGSPGSNKLVLKLLVKNIGIFSFPCAYQVLDMDKLDRDGLYELTFWVKGVNNETGLVDDSAKIKAGLAFITDPYTTTLADSTLYDLVSGKISDYKRGNLVEVRDDWVKVKAKFTLDGSGKSMNGNDGINDLNNVSKIILYVGKPYDTGVPENHVLYDFITIERVR